LPRELQPTDAEVRAKRWKISKEAKDRLGAEECCAKCGAPPFLAFINPEPAALWEWLSEYDEDLLAVIQKDLRGKAGVEMSDWFFHVSPTMKMKITRRLTQSPLVVDHGIPRKIGDFHWQKLSRSSRRFLQQNFLFALCKKCNGSKSAKLFDRHELIRMYIDTYYDGSIAAAKSDARRWELLEETLRPFYEEQRTA